MKKVKLIITLILSAPIMSANMLLTDSNAQAQTQNGEESAVIAAPKEDNNKLLLDKESSKLVYQAQDYLSKIKTVRARFAQISPDNLPLSNGHLYISRPGKLMIKYTDPFNLFYYIVDDNFTQYDMDLDQVTRASAPDNPLRVLLYDNIRFYDNKIMSVGGVKDHGEAFSIYLASHNEDYTQITGLVLKFAKNPTKLIAIKRVDSEGNMTSMNLLDVEINTELEDDVFHFVRPKSKYPTSKK